MARPPADRPNADEPQPDDEAVALDAGDSVEESVAATDPVEDDDTDAHAASRTASANRFWESVRIDPVEVALPAGVGYTLRAYRQNTDVTPADVSAREEDVPMPRRRATTVDLDGEFDEDAERLAEAELDDELAEERLGLAAGADEDDEDAELAGADEDEDEAAEDVPVFLTQGGHLLLFHSSESLVNFVRSDAEHDLQQLDTWDSATEGIRSEYVVSLPDDTYELDLVVKNLRGGHDVWDPELLVRSGQFARDLGYALRIEPVMLALAPGSPLDDLDEALRAVAGGGIGTFFARRRLKKIGAETASLGWRSVVGKISAVVDWRD